MEDPSRVEDLSLNLEEYKQQQQAQQQIQLLEQTIKQRLTKEAFQRYGNIKAANPEFAVHILLVLAQYFEKMKLRTIGDDEFKALLKQIVPKRRNISIKRK